MADLLSALADARAALLGIPNAPPVLLPGDEDPDTPEVIVLDWVSNTGLPQYGGTPTSKRVQVTAYAATLARALELSEQARTAMREAGFGFLASRPAPDPDAIGVISEHRR
ncbi:hypothetical protein DEIPH_ctg041orf0009 [Deinococcus phoenicis]|uniref:Uncharacterized protein n=1 Tax=Deinococcus phoenicis TaxID=1476583 RepID=A0A016QMW4_9DEIO|nr:hypothetical protein [Deinococcus phoenicis]EYB67413.1 hypothetical protein DEIPH_ctg041orf0009 [Deinococcus phoenicis]